MTIGECCLSECLVVKMWNAGLKRRNMALASVKGGGWYSKFLCFLWLCSFNSSIRSSYNYHNNSDPPAPLFQITPFVNNSMINKGQCSKITCTQKRKNLYHYLGVSPKTFFPAFQYSNLTWPHRIINGDHLSPLGNYLDSTWAPLGKTLTPLGTIWKGEHLVTK